MYEFGFVRSFVHKFWKICMHSMYVYVRPNIGDACVWTVPNQSVSRVFDVHTIKNETFILFIEHLNVTFLFSRI